MPKHRYVIVLAANPSEGATYARRTGLPARTYRVPAAAKSIKGLQAADVHVLPTFATRPDRHAILAELRHGRDIVMVDVQMPAPAEPAPVDQGDGMGEQLTIDDFLGRVRDTGKAEPCEFDDVQIDIPATVALIRPENPDLADAIEAANPQEDASGSTPGTTESGEDAASTQARRRRTRCAECGELTFEAHDHSRDPAPVGDFF